MTAISPPNYTGSRSKVATTSASDLQRIRQQEAETKAYLASPEGQAAEVSRLAAQDAEDKLSLEANKQAFIRTGYWEFDEQGKMIRTGKKRVKHHEKDEAGKSTGFLNGIVSKLKRK